MKDILAAVVVLCLVFLSCVTYAEVEKQGSFYKATCECNCRGGVIESSALYKPGLGAIPQVAEVDALAKCQEQCARTCGGYTTCQAQSGSECKTCCSGYCSSEYGGSSKGQCEESCASTCSYKGLINGITEIIYEVAGVIAALMIVIHGIRMATAQETADRNSAKSSIVHVILALIIIVLAGSLVNLFLGSVSAPPRGGGSTPTTTLAGGGGGGSVDCSACAAAGSCNIDSCLYLQGCFFNELSGTCLPCSGVVTKCQEYIGSTFAFGEKVCKGNPCKVSGGCYWTLTKGCLSCPSDCTGYDNGILCTGNQCNFAGGCEWGASGCKPK